MTPDTKPPRSKGRTEYMHTLVRKGSLLLCATPTGRLYEVEFLHLVALPVGAAGGYIACRSERAARKLARSIHRATYIGRKQP